MNWKDSLLGGCLALCLLAPTTNAPAVAEPLGEGKQESDRMSGRYPQSLPLGQPGLPESRTTTFVAPGVTHTVIVRGERSGSDVYVVDVAFRATPEAATAVALSLRTQGYQPRVEPVLDREPNSPKRGALGYLVRVGAFNSEAEAADLQDRLAMDGYSDLRVVYTGEDGGKTTGPWVVNVIEVDPAQFKGTLAPALATEIVPGNEPLTSIAARTNALAAVNGGYFVIEPTDGTPGDLAGISVVDGVLVSEAVDGRTNLILPDGSGRNARIAALTSFQAATATDGAVREVDGHNRQPGLVRNCGGVGGDIPTEKPRHDFTCTDSSELIQFTPAFGQTTLAGEGAEVVLDSSGRVIEIRRERGGQIPRNGSVLSGTGDAAQWLLTHAQSGTLIDINTRVLANGKALPMEETLGVVNGGPRLLRNGFVEIPAAAEGFYRQSEPEFYYRFGVRRNPRTLAGITASGKLLLIAVDGRQPGWSVGTSFEESAWIMRSLGAVDAINLDGGGSTTMTVGKQLVNRPSDSTGERPIADAIIIQP